MDGSGRYTEKDCLRSLKRAAEELDSAPTRDEYDSLDMKPSSGTIVDRCGTWHLALAKIGRERETRRQYTEADCLNAIQNCAEDFGGEPSISVYSSGNYLPSITTITNICGSWSEAKEMAGVTDFDEKSPSEEADEFFEQLDGAERLE